MGRAALFTTVIIFGLLVSRLSLAQSGYAPLAPGPTPTPVRVPPGYHIERRVRMGPLVTGSVFAGLGYLLAWSLAAHGCPGDRWLYVPMAGPVLALAMERDHVTSGPCDDPEGIGHAIRTWSAILQGVGGVLVLVGASYPSIDLVADAPKRHAHGNSGRTLAVAPALGPSTASVVVLGSF